MGLLLQMAGAAQQVAVRAVQHQGTSRLCLRHVAW
jgi:hypothetical protein